MCRRHVQDEQVGILRIVEELDRAFRGTRCRFHCFGLKTTGMSELRQHPRVQSVDSQAWGMTARIDARKARISKSNRYLATVMAAWYQEQLRHLRQSGYAFRAHPEPLRFAAALEPVSASDAQYAAAADKLRMLYQAGEVEWADLSPMRVAEWMALSDD